MIKSYFYTETAFHHEGDLTYIKGLVDATKNTGAKGIKFQVMTNTSDFVSTKHNAYNTLDTYRFSFNQWSEIFTYTQESGLDIIMMPLNLEAFKLLPKFNVKYLDIHSVSFYDIELLKAIKISKCEIILGVGGRTLEEIVDKFDFFGPKLKVLMTGFQSFPSQLEDVKIGKISYLKNLFPDCHIGYADHSAYDHPHAILSNEYARLLGATFFEKHITTTEGLERVDFSAAVSQDKIKEIITKIEFLEKNILTDFIESFHLNDKEVTYRNRQLTCVIAKKMDKGSILKKEDILLKLIDVTEVSHTRIESLIGKKLINNLELDDAIRIVDIE